MKFYTYKDLGEKKEIREIGKYRYYRSILSFVFEKDTINSLDGEAILHDETRGYIKVKSIREYGEEKNPGKIFIREEFFIKDLSNLDKENKEFFKKAVKIRDEANKAREKMKEQFEDEEKENKNKEIKISYFYDTRYAIKIVTPITVETLAKCELFDREEGKFLDVFQWTPDEFYDNCSDISSDGWKLTEDEYSVLIHAERGRGYDREPSPERGINIRHYHYKTPQENIEKDQAENEVRDIIAGDDDRLKSLISALEPGELLIITNTDDGRMFKGKGSKGIPNGKGRWVNKNGDVFGGEFVDGIANGEGYVRFGDGTELKGEWKNSVLKADGGKDKGSVTFHIEDLEYDNISNKLVVQRNEDGGISVFEGR